MSTVWPSPTRWRNRFLSWIRVLRFDYSRITRVSSTSFGSSNEPAVFAHFWLRQGRRLLRPHFSCLHSRFTVVRSLSWVIALCGVRPGCCCVGDDRLDDYSADSSASLAQCCRCGGFFPSFAIFALIWGLLLFLRNFSLLFLGYPYGVPFFAPSVYSPLLSLLL